MSAQQAVEKFVRDRGLASRDIEETAKAGVPYDLKLIRTAKDIPDETEYVGFGIYD